MMNSTRFSIIAAMASNRVIGVNNTLPWRLPADLAHFKSLTLGHHIIMGRKTWDSLGRPLPGRTSVVVTRDRDFNMPGCVAAHSLVEAMSACKGDAEAFFIGGANLYRQALDFADRIYLTEVGTEVAGDAWFPEFDRDRWVESARKHRAADAENPFELDFVIFDRSGKLGG